MAVGGENPEKVANIVKAQMDYFRRLYAPILERLGDHLVDCGHGRYNVGANRSCRGIIIH
jgi:hypothetical protein